MGSGSSKPSLATATAAASSSSSARGRAGRSLRVFNSSCFGLPPTLSDHQTEDDNGRSRGKKCTDEGDIISGDGDNETCKKLIVSRSADTPSQASTDVELKEKGQEGTSHIESEPSSSSTTTAVTSRSSNPPGRLRSRFGFNHEGIGFRLSRAVSLGSSGAGTRLSASLSIPVVDVGDQLNLGSSSCYRSDTQENTMTHTGSSQDLVQNNPIIEPTISGHSHRTHAEHESSFELRRSSRRLGPHESLEGSVRFSRTLSVGRLRERVLRGASLSEGLFGPSLLDDRSVSYMRQSSGRRVIGGIRRTPPSFSNRSNEGLPDSSDQNHHRSSSIDSVHAQDPETPHLREASNHDLLEHRSTFLERRRRIRSQVRALQRLGSRFENLSGHDRSCILSGLHRTGRCTCRTINRPANPDDEMNNRASISRIVMLAEALFEVLDEIHQQSVVLSSRPSFSSIGSVPAPKEVVEGMPLKAYLKSQKRQNDIEQCYICLMEYEEGDSIRILPCNHEFHQICIDKWLKEIHRVCPLCRGDVCRANVSTMDKLS